VSISAVDLRPPSYASVKSAHFGIYGTVIAAEFRTSPSNTTVKGEVHVTSKLYETRGAMVVYTLDTKVHNIESSGDGLAALTPRIGKSLHKEGLIR